MSMRSGIRALVSDSISIEAGGGYLSLGQSGLDEWEARLHVAFSF